MQVENLVHTSSVPPRVDGVVDRAKPWPDGRRAKLSDADRGLVVVLPQDKVWPYYHPYTPCPGLTLLDLRNIPALFKFYLHRMMSTKTYISDSLLDEIVDALRYAPNWGPGSPTPEEYRAESIASYAHIVDPLISMEEWIEAREWLMVRTWVMQTIRGNPEIGSITCMELERKFQLAVDFQIMETIPNAMPFQRFTEGARINLGFFAQAILEELLDTGWYRRDGTHSYSDDIRSQDGTIIQMGRIHSLLHFAMYPPDSAVTATHTKQLVCDCGCGAPLFHHLANCPMLGPLTLNETALEFVRGPSRRTRRLLYEFDDKGRSTMLVDGELNRAQLPYEPCRRAPALSFTAAEFKAIVAREAAAAPGSSSAHASAPGSSSTP